MSPLSVSLFLGALVCYAIWDLRQGEPCPECESNALWFRVHRRGEQGASWAYFACRSCGARVRQRPDGPWEAVTPEIWAEQVGE